MKKKEEKEMGERVWAFFLKKKKTGEKKLKLRGCLFCGRWVPIG